MQCFSEFKAVLSLTRSPNFGNMLSVELKDFPEKTSRQLCALQSVTQVPQ